MPKPQPKATKPLTLVHATPAQQNAAWAKIYPELVALAQYYSEQVHVPFVNVEAMVMEKLQTPQFKQQAMQIIDDALNAALNVQEPTT